MSGLLSHRVLVVLLIAVLAAAGDACAQTTWYVDDDAGGDPVAGDPTVSDPNEDGSAAHPFDAIQEGIDAASNGDTVLVLDGTYTGVGNRDLDFGGRLITVRSANGAAGCVIDCQGLGRGFYFHSGETAAAVVEGFTITDGYTSGYTGDNGGGMCNEDSSPTMTHCTFSGNTADDVGGGMFNDESSPMVTNCILWNDTPDEIYNYDPNSVPTVTYSDVQGGYAGTGNINADPLFADAGSGDYHLTPGSPCVNTGDNAAAVVFADTTTAAGTQTSVIVADPSRYAINDEIEYDGDGALRTVTVADPNSGQVIFDDPLASPSDPNVPVANYGWGDIDGDDRIVGQTVDMGADEFVPPQLMTTEPPADGTLPKTANNVVLLTFDKPITLPADPNEPPLSIAAIAGGPELGSQFTYQIDPNNVSRKTLKVVENGEALTNLVWYRITPTTGFDVMPFILDFATLRGDADNSGRVTTSDYSEVKAHIGESTDAICDLDGSGRVTTADYSVVKGHLGRRATVKP